MAPPGKPPYDPGFEIYGWKAVADRLCHLVARGQWNNVPALIGDEIVETFALRAGWAELPAKVLEKYGGLLDRVRYTRMFRAGTRKDGVPSSQDSRQK